MKIIDDLQPVTSAEYRETVEEFTEFFAGRYGDEAALYRFGNRDHPPLSDLDLAIVVDESRSSARRIAGMIADARHFVRADRRRRYLFTHDILIFPRRRFARSMYDISLSEKELLHGRDIPFERPSDEEDEKRVLRLRFVSYATNTMRNFTRVRRLGSIGCRDLLKLFNSAAHLISDWLVLGEEADGESREALTAWSDALGRRRKAFGTKGCGDREALLRVFEEDARRLELFYDSCMTRLSETVTGERIDRKLWYLENGTLVNKHLFFLLTGALYARIFREKELCFARRHGAMYALKDTKSRFGEAYVSVVRRQAESLKDACRFYYRFGIMTAGPLMCSYCRPELRGRERLRFLVQRGLYRIQGW